MGCCFGRCTDSDSQVSSADERTHLLNDPVSNASSVQRVQSDEYLTQHSNSSPKSTDEQSYLNKILQETATNVIDVAALAPSNIEQNEYLERRSHYNAKLASMPWHAGSLGSGCLLLDVAVPEKLLIPPPISVQDYSMIKESAGRIKSALQELQVNHTEDLIVPFEIP